MKFFIPSTNILFEEEFEKYQKSTHFVGEYPSRETKVFDIRFRLAFGKKISFDSSITYTKTQVVKKATVLMIQISDLWFAYESLLPLCLRSPEFISQREIGKITFLNDLQRKVIGLEKVTEHFQLIFEDQVISKTNRRLDLITLLYYMESITIGSTFRSVKKARKKIERFERWVLADFLALAYAIRVGYVHNGDTAHAGVNNYSSKVKILEVVYDFLLIVMFKTSNHLFSKYRVNYTTFMAPESNKAGMPSLKRRH